MQECSEDCWEKCDTDCESGQWHCWYIHQPKGSGWHSLGDCPHYTNCPHHGLQPMYTVSGVASEPTCIECI